jgi:hypothetical protein
VDLNGNEAHFHSCSFILCVILFIGNADELAFLKVFHLVSKSYFFKHVALTAQLRLDSDDSPDDEPHPAVMYHHNMPGRTGIRDLPDQYSNRMPTATRGGDPFSGVCGGWGGGDLPTSRPQPHRLFGLRWGDW